MNIYDLADCDFCARRSEAKSVPNLLVAPVSTTNGQEGGLYDNYPQGYYADGAYTATPLPASISGFEEGSDDAQEDIDPQEAYYSALCARFARLSSILQETPSAPSDASVSLPIYRVKQWRHKILKSTPNMVLLARIPQESIIVGAEVLEDMLTASNLRGAHGRNISAWAWALLARCRDVGSMGSEEVGVLRSLGKKAVWLLRRIAAGKVGEDKVPGDDEECVDEEGGVVDVPDEEDETVEGANERIRHGHITADGAERETMDAENGEPPGESIEADTDSAVAAARERMLADLNNAGSNTAEEKETVLDKEAMHATLDMIVTVVGEFYGQRDLLDGRLLWDELE